MIGYISILGTWVSNLLQLFRWQDGLDILILSYIFYRLYLWLKKKRALRMVIAILSLPIFYLIGRWMDLPLSIWIFQNMWSVIIIILVVIFQQEIREVLGNISLPSFLFGNPEDISPKAIDKIAGAVFQMVDRKMGGLIVFQRRDNLDEMIHEKKFLDGEVSEDILLNIFDPQSLLHDGSIVIHGDRIRYMAAILPLSRSASIPKEWGTRHRAGLGITEVSDAKCVIISEERGEVLLASEGKVKRIGSKEELKENLIEVFPVENIRDKKRGLLKRIFDDIPKKIFFLFLVCFLWIFVIAIPQREINYSIPIEYYSIPKDLEITGDPPREINVILKGSQRILSSMKPNQIRVQVNL
ncbi:MAG: diadenylate cyclase, partial [Thermodesulfobacteriota bacterium]